MDDISTLLSRSVRSGIPSTITIVDLGLAGLGLCFVFLLRNAFFKRVKIGLPVVNAADHTELFTSRAKLNFQARAEELIRQGFEKV
jgi:hypothetical protein